MKKLTTILKKLGTFKDVSNMTSSRGNDIPNQFILEFTNGRLFKSYNSVIAVQIFGGKTYLTPHWDYSATTGKYRNDFLNCGVAECRENLKNGTFELVEGTKYNR